MSLKQRKNIAGSINPAAIKGSTGRNALIRKELADHLTSKRFLILMILIGATSFASLYGAISGLSDAISQDSNFIFLKLYTSSGSSIPSFMSFIALLGPIVGLALGFDAVNSERANGTLNRLVAQPIYRDSIIIGKFLAGTAVIAIVILWVLRLGCRNGSDRTGTGYEEVLRILIFLIFTVIYAAFWLALSILFSNRADMRRPPHSASTLWRIFFDLHEPGGIIANGVSGEMIIMQMINSPNDYTLNLNLNRISRRITSYSKTDDHELMVVHRMCNNGANRMVGRSAIPAP